MLLGKKVENCVMNLHFRSKDRLDFIKLKMHAWRNLVSWRITSLLIRHFSTLSEHYLISPVYKYPPLTASFVKVRFIGCIIFFFIVCVGVRGWVDEEMVNITRHCLTQW